MQLQFDSIDTAFEVLADPSNEGWAQAFAYLFSNPETSSLMMETFQDTLADMGAEATGKDPVTGEPMYSLDDVARAMGIPAADLQQDLDESVAPTRR